MESLSGILYRLLDAGLGDAVRDATLKQNFGSVYIEVHNNVYIPYLDWVSFQLRAQILDDLGSE